MIFPNLQQSFLIYLNRIDRTIATTCRWLILQARPLLGPGDICPFVIGCTNFALIALETRSTPVAVAIITKRLLMCNPIWLWFNTPK